MASKWFYRNGSDEVGPVSSTEVRSLVKTGKIVPSTPLRKTDAEKWTKAGRIKGLFDGIQTEEEEVDPLIALASQATSSVASATSSAASTIGNAVPAASRPKSPPTPVPNHAEDSFNSSPPSRKPNRNVSRTGLWVGLGVGVFVLIFTTIGLTLLGTGLFTNGTTRREIESTNSVKIVGLPTNLSTALTPKDDNTKPKPKSESLSERSNAHASATSPAPTATPQTNDGQTKPKLNSENLGSWGVALGLESGVIKRIGQVDVALGYKFSTVYVPKNASNIVEANMPSYGIFFPVGYRKADGTFANPTAGFIPVNGEPQKIEYASSDASIVEVFEDGSAGFRGEGKAVITLRVAGESISVALTVIGLPVNASRVPRTLRGNATSAEESIRQLGLPDEKTKYYISWPKNKKINGIFYSPSAGGGIATEHWTYKKYPGAVIAIVGNSTSGWVWCVGTYKDK